MRRILGFGAVALAALLCGTAQARDQDENSFKHLVGIGGGRHLNMVCTGKGSPTVIFLQGLGGDMTNWDKIREPISSTTRACFYDRAGQGYSDPSNKPSTAENVTDDLHALLRAAGVKGPVVLAGHSLGGMFATLYADKFLPGLAGMVLVDPSFDGQFDYAGSKRDKEIVRQNNDQFTSLMKACIKLAQDHGLSERDNHGCFHPPQDVTPEGAKYISQQFYRPS